MDFEAKTGLNCHFDWMARTDPSCHSDSRAKKGQRCHFRLTAMLEWEQLLDSMGTRDWSFRSDLRVLREMKEDLLELDWRKQVSLTARAGQEEVLKASIQPGSTSPAVV